MGAGQPEVRLAVRDLERSAALYRRLGFEDVAGDDPALRRLTLPGLGLVLAEGAHNQVRTASDRQGQPELGVVLAIPTPDLDGVHRYWEEEGMLVVSAPHRDGARRVFHGLDPDGYQLRFEESRSG